jgi:menaquinol-cytochrome c reductase iron-sulfur subunit
MASASNASVPSSESAPGRRTFFRWLTFGLGAVATAVVSVPFLGYLLGARKSPVDWLPLGPVEDFPLNQTRRVTFRNLIRQPWDGMVANTGVYVRYEGLDENGSNETKGYKFLVLAVNCAHLGCPVEWFPESGLFMCPCHGGVYYANGERASGPPPQGLFRCVYRVTRVRGLDLLEIQAPHFPTLQDTLTGRREEG